MRRSVDVCKLLWRRLLLLLATVVDFGAHQKMGGRERVRIHSLPFGRIKPGVEVEFLIVLLVNVFI